jgi:prepilin-type N-terminal cleavage/methylation domain-containing protein
MITPAHRPSARARLTAFTLIELLTVIAIIGILAGIIIPTVGKVKITANKAKSKNQFVQIATAMEVFKQEYGYYPSIAKAGKVDDERFASAMTGRRNFKGDALGTNATARELSGNVKRINFYTPSDSELSENANKRLLIDAFGNTDIAVRVDVDGDGKIDKRDERFQNGSSVYTPAWVPVKSFNTGKTFNPTTTDRTINTDGIKAGVVLYSAGNGESDSDMVLSWK